MKHNTLRSPWSQACGFGMTYCTMLPCGIDSESTRYPLSSFTHCDAPSARIAPSPGYEPSLEVNVPMASPSCGVEHGFTDSVRTLLSLEPIRPEGSVKQSLGCRSKMGTVPDVTTSPLAFRCAGP